MSPLLSFGRYYTPSTMNAMYKKKTSMCTICHVLYRSLVVNILPLTVKKAVIQKHK